MLRIHDFATECNWDHLYVFDGASVEAPLLAAFRYVRLLSFDSWLLQYKASYRAIQCTVYVFTSSIFCGCLSDTSSVCLSISMSVYLFVCPFGIFVCLVESLICETSRCPVLRLLISAAFFLGSHQNSTAVDRARDDFVLINTPCFHMHKP